MVQPPVLSLVTLRAILRRLMSGPQVLAFLPALALAAFWTGGEGALVIVALGVPLIVLLAGGFERLPGAGGRRDGATGLPLADSLRTRLEDALTLGNARGLKTACFLVRIEDYEALAGRITPHGAEELIGLTASRLRGALRDGDHIALVEHGTLGIGLRAVPHMDLEAAIQLAARLQTAAEEPVILEGVTHYPTVAIGFCLSTRAPARSRRGLIEGAGIALAEALRNGPSAIRIYSAEMGAQQGSRDTLEADALAALDNGEIVPWFQPQISTDTGRVTGFEALARWMHPRRGTIPPAEFLPLLQKAGQMERLGEVILFGALQAVAAWDAAGVHVPCVAVNLSGEELRDPRLADRIRWDLDRFDLAPERLTVEVLETVVVGAPEDIATQNITRLAAMGCRIDLDDFGTGHASISAIRRFAIERIKIDRSFITHVDDDAEQRRMISAILSMAERLGLETLAEGVETAGEHAMLAQLGCDHVQGFGIARPMPFEETLGWMRRHEARLATPPRIGRGTR